MAGVAGEEAGGVHAEEEVDGAGERGEARAIIRKGTALQEDIRARGIVSTTRRQYSASFRLAALLRADYMAFVAPESSPG